MDSPQLPDELAALERNLAARPRPEPTDALRQRVMAGVRSGLAARPAPPRHALSVWEFAAALAAAVLLWVNLSMSAVNRMEWEAGSRSPNGTDRAVAALRNLAPDLSEQEARRQVILWKAADRLVRAPKPQPPARGVHRTVIPDA